MMMMLTCPPLYKIAHRGRNEVMEGKHFETVQEPYSWEAQLFCIENEKKKQDRKESHCLYANLESPKAIIKAIILTFRFKQSFSQFFCICFVFEQNQSKGGREKASKGEDPGNSDMVARERRETRRLEVTGSDRGGAVKFLSL